MSLASCIYQGRVRHRRHTPVPHSFRYSIFQMYLDLAELPGLFAGRWLWSSSRPAPAWFRREDHLGPPALPLADAVRDLVESRTGQRPGGPIRLLTHLRYFGYCFNPVSFFYCFDRAGTRVEAIVADVSNTPWNERHAYVLGREAAEVRGKALRFRFAKAFHVSPFLGMGLAYDWRFREPGAGLVVHMECRDEGSLVLDATLALRRREIDRRALALSLLRHPMMTAEVIAGIHAQALRLWWKRVPVHTHPARMSPPADD